jgi:hypothetical protein
LPPGGASAFAWIHEQVPQDAVLATNRQCLGAEQGIDCPLPRVFWLSGLGGRQVLLEGWAYSMTDGAASGATTFPWGERLRHNDAVFSAPTPANVDRLRRQYGVTWLVADRTAGEVSPNLARLAVPRFSSGAVTVYELR